MRCHEVSNFANGHLDHLGPGQEHSLHLHLKSKNLGVVCDNCMCFVDLDISVNIFVASGMHQKV